jgi:hypothetical protein
MIHVGSENHGRAAPAPRMSRIEIAKAIALDWDIVFGTDSPHFCLHQKFVIWRGWLTHQPFSNPSKFR